MRPERRSRRRLALEGVVVLQFLVFSLASYSPAVRADYTAATGFNVINTAWGTATATSSPAPGDQDVPLTITLQYYYYNSANGIQGTLVMPAGFTGINGGPIATTFLTGTTTSGTTVQMTFYVNIGTNAQLGSYSFPLTITWGAVITSQQSVSLIQTTQAALSLRGRPELVFSTVQKSLLPGQVNSVTFVVTNAGAGNASGLSTTITMSPGSVLGLYPNIVMLPAGASFGSSANVFLPASSAGSAVIFTFVVSYKDAYGTSQTLTTTTGAYVSSVAAPQGPVVALDPQNNVVTSGSVSKVSFVIRNQGGSAFSSPLVTLSVPAPLAVIANSTLSFSGVDVPPGGTVLYSALVAVGASTSAIGGVYLGTVTVTYIDQTGNVQTQSLPVNLNVMIPIVQVSVSAIASQVGVGKTSVVSFMIANTGNAPVYSPTFSLTVPSGLAVTSNATFSRSGLVINPAKSVKYVANVTCGPKVAEGAYIATVTVVYADQFGNAHTSTFSVGLVAVGNIQLVIQNERVSQNGTTFSVTGTLLNEGLANAYYAQVTATLEAGASQLATATSYVGEVDSNTPLPVAVSFTVPASRLASLNGTATLTLQANYLNDFGQALQFKTSEPVSFSSGADSSKSTAATTSQLTFSTQSVDIIRYAAIIAILVAAVVTVAYMRRGRSRGKRTSSQKSDVY